MKPRTAAPQNSPASGQRRPMEIDRPNSTIRLGPSIRNRESETES